MDRTLAGEPARGLLLPGEQGGDPTRSRHVTGMPAWRPFPSTAARGKLAAEPRFLDSLEWGGEPMPQYIMLVNFTDQGVRGIKDVPNRQDKSRETAKQFGVERKTV